MVRVLFFGKFADAAGGRNASFALEPGGATIAGLIETIGRENEELAAMLKARATQFIVNQSIVPVGAEIGEGDEVAFLPPVSGG